MNEMKTLTYAQLVRAKADYAERVRFKTQFGKSVQVDEAFCLVAVGWLGWEWIVQHLLDPAALAEYRQARTAAQLERDRACHEAGIGRDQECAESRLEWGNLCTSACVKYDQARAMAFIRFYRPSTA